MKHVIGVVCIWIVVCGSVLADSQAVQGELRSAMIPAPSLVNSLFRTVTEQPAAVYLPPSYSDTTRRFPVVYFLPGYGCPVHYFTVWGVFQGFSLQQSLDSLIRGNFAGEMIVVIPNGLNFMGGSFYTNSPVTGNWEDFITQDVVGFTDSHYRTIPQSRARGISGYSMGGSGALSIGMKHPDIFGSVYALSPGVFAPGGLGTTVMFAETSTVTTYLDREADFNKTAECEAVVRFMSFIDNLYKANQEEPTFVYAYGSAFAPDTSARAPFIDYPYHRVDGKLVIDSVAWKRFESGFGDWPAKIARYRENLRKLAAITIDYGTKDENPWIPTGCVYLSALLDSAGIAHETLSFEGGHGDRVRERIEGHIIPFFAKHLAKE